MSFAVPIFLEGFGSELLRSAVLVMQSDVFSQNWTPPLCVHLYFTANELFTSIYKGISIVKLKPLFVPWNVYLWRAAPNCFTIQDLKSRRNQGGCDLFLFFILKWLIANKREIYVLLLYNKTNNDNKFLYCTSIFHQDQRFQSRKQRVPQLLEVFYWVIIERCCS